MISFWKKYTIFLIQSPLVAFGLLSRTLVALVTFFYLRWIRPGISTGKKIHTFLEYHEMGYIKPRKNKGNKK